jgi:ketosteroid isomerase-like protein
MLLSRVACMFVLACFAPLALADAPKKEWQTRYDGLSKAVRDRDFDRFQSFAAVDYTWTPLKGRTMNRKEAIDAYAPVFKMKSVSGGEKVLRVLKTSGGVDIEYESRFTFVTPNGTKSRMHEIGIDTWRRRDGAWKIVRTVTKRSDSK